MLWQGWPANSVSSMVSWFLNQSLNSIHPELGAMRDHPILGGRQHLVEVRRMNSGASLGSLEQKSFFTSGRFLGHQFSSRDFSTKTTAFSKRTDTHMSSAGNLSHTCRGWFRG